MFEFNEELAMQETANTGKKVLDTGVYDVTINTLSKTVSNNGTIGFDINFTVDGYKYPNTIYGIWVRKANGEDITFNMAKIQNLMGIVGAKKLTEFSKEIEVKGGTKTVTAYKELEGKKVKLVIKKVYDFYNEVREKNEIEAFLYTSGHTYSEKIKGIEPKQIKYYQEKLKDGETNEYKKHMADQTESGAEAPWDDDNDDSNIL